VIVATITASGANAQTDAYDPRSYITDKEIRSLHSKLITIIEPHQSPLSVAETRRLVVSSVLSALAEKCNLPWDKQIYLPMMAYFRHSKKLNERQMTLVGMLHGVQQGYILAGLPVEPCPPQIRDQISRAISSQK
jgi:hypothetical protein